MRTRLRRHARRLKVVVYEETLFDFNEHLWTFLGAFVGIGLVGLLHRYHVAPADAPLLIGSFGASSVLIYGVINSPLAQPRNLVGGHVLSALVGVTAQRLLPQEPWLAAALAVALSIVLMQISKTLHPPGGATALIAVIGSAQIKALGYWYVLVPVLSGACVLLAVALVVNNITPTRNYPRNPHWYRIWKRRYVG
ncbi:HPP family protein [Hymenobacter properus]|uniref:HPP family protein n=1 Tax=Hymenobacter properus TaxID=2791026 RepID=A0A931BEZ4_9BACT|nr:HPP family protein [Hymenobacter properus]MBF9142629.1 HPP family protein [Hymenobacter properus]MBR7721437.1 HPP family protein [Microvirga sp. SRT04]